MTSTATRKTGPMTFASAIAAGRSLPEAPARALHCVMCAAPMSDRRGLHCDIGGPVPWQLAQAIVQAAPSAELPRIPAHEPKLASYLWYPGCTTELEGYTQQDLLHCAMCGLQMARPEDRDVDAFRARHPAF